MRFIGLGRRASAAAARGTSALKYVGLGKRQSAMKYIGLGKRAPDRSAVHYIGLGKRTGAGERSALRYVGLGKRKSAIDYVGLQGKQIGARRRYDDATRRAQKRGRRRVKLGGRWSSSTVDPALLIMGIGRK